MARNYSEEYARRQRRAEEAGEESYSEQRKSRKKTSEILEGRTPWVGSKFLRDNPKGEKELRTAWSEGKLMGIARRSGNKTGVEYHRRRMDAALLDLQIRRPDFDVQEHFWYH